MIYNTSKVIGDAGEHLLGFLIPYLHKCIYRISNIDIGIDGEIEIIENEISTGNFIKVQVKTTDTDDFSHNNILYQINEAHIEYWKKLSIPVLLCRVFLKSQKIYCLPINDSMKIMQSSTEGKINIDFSDSFEIRDKQFTEIIKKYSESKNKEVINMITSKLDNISQEVSVIPEPNNPLLLANSTDYFEKIYKILDNLSSIEKTIKIFNLNAVNPEFDKKIQNYYYQLNARLKMLRAND